MQDLFAEIIGSNVSFFTPVGTYLNKPSQVTPSCSDLAKPLSTAPSSTEFECVNQSFQNALRDKQHSFSCIHGLHFFAAGFQPELRGIGGVVIGPLLIGKREDESAYRKICETLSIDPDVFFDRIREIKVFSFHGVQVVLDFLREMTEYTFRLSEQQKQFEELIPGYQEELKKSDRLSPGLPLDHAANYLLDIALLMLKADSGSVLLFNENSESFSIKASRGLKPEVLQRSRIPAHESVAGWVIKNKYPILIDRDFKNPLLQSRLNRPELTSSILVPIACQEKPFGVLCVNAMSENVRFNAENLTVLDKLGKLTGITALPAFSQPPPQ